MFVQQKKERKKEKYMVLNTSPGAVFEVNKRVIGRV